MGDASPTGRSRGSFQKCRNKHQYLPCACVTAGKRRETDEPCRWEALFARRADKQATHCSKAKSKSTAGSSSCVAKLRCDFEFKLFDVGPCGCARPPIPPSLVRHCARLGLRNCIVGSLASRPSSLSHNPETTSLRHPCCHHS
jgi:hypothetical protein